MEKGRITSIADFQMLQNVWEKQILCDEQLTPQGRFNRMMEEVDEAKEEMAQLNGSEASRQRLASEVADVIFVALGVLSTLNISAEDELNRILDQNYRKYSPIENKRLRENGASHEEALAIQKNIWNRNMLRAPMGKK